MSDSTASSGPNTRTSPNLQAFPRVSSHTEDKNSPFDSPHDRDEDEDEWWDDEKQEEHVDEYSSEKKENHFTEENQEFAMEEDYPGNPQNTPVIPADSRTPPWLNIEQKVDVEGPKAARHTVARNPGKRYSVQKPARDKSLGRQRKQNADAGIKVITDFSQRAGSSQVVEPVQVPAAAPGQGKEARDFVSLATLQALDKEVPLQPTGWNFWSKKSKKLEVAKSANKASAIDATEVPSISSRTGSKPVPAALKLEHDLSPNDRPIVIGLSVSSAKLAEQAQSPQTAVSEATRIVQSYKDREGDSISPETPAPNISVTRASGESTWSPIDGKHGAPQRRPTSSIYSQATNISPNPNGHASRPPVPAVPVHLLKGHMAPQDNHRSVPSRESTDTVFDEDTPFSQRSPTRRISTFTVFEEDETPTQAQVTPHRATDIPESSRDESLNTPATNRRSRGWWNYVMTPFMTRSNTVAAKQDVMRDGQPTTPSLEAAATKARDSNRANQVWEKEFSPSTATTMSSEAWYRNGNRKLEPQTPTIRAVEPEGDEHARTHRVQDSSATLPFVMSAGSTEDARRQSTQLHSNNPFQNLGRESSLSFAHRRLERDLARQASAATAMSNSDRDIPLVFDIDSPVQSRTNPFVQPRPTVSTNGEQDVRYSRFPPPPPPAPVHVTNITYNVALGWQSEERSAPRSNDSQFTSPRLPPPYSPPRSQFARFVPRGLARTTDNDISPDPVSPGMQQIMTSAGGIPLRDIGLESPRRRPIDLNSGYPTSLPARTGGAYVIAADLVTPAELARKAEAQRKRHEKEDALARKAGGFWRGRCCIPKKGCFGRKGAEGRKKRRCYIWLIIAFLLILALIISLVTSLTRKSHSDADLTQWLNLTGFPPMFLGVSTIAVPVNTLVDTSCVIPATFWSCDIPKELQSTVAPSGPNQPNFRLEIQWDNSSAANATFVNVTGSKNFPVKRGSNGMSVGQFVRRLFLRARQTTAFIPIPSPPSFAEEFFLGNTTDGIVSVEKAGEPTPFYITLLSPTGDISADLSPLRKRTSSSNSTTNSNSSTDDKFPDIIAGIPPPSINTADGTAAPANLFPNPLPIQQPIRLYDRALPTEHYGFYSYFDRSIFLSSVNLTTGSGEVPTDGNGGATEDEAKFRCTWAQTRFVVQIWTKKGNTAQLLNTTSTSSSSSEDSTQITNKHQPSTAFIASDFSQPGSFPYPVTVTLDRHGGNATKKEIYCYQIDDRQMYVDVHPTIQLENRAAGGTLIGQAPSLFGGGNVMDGGVDGGSGGCKCGWMNWVAVSG